MPHPSITTHNLIPACSKSDRLNSDRIQQTSRKQALPTMKKHESEDTQLDYHQLTIRQLKKIAQQRKIKRYGNMRKADLILALTT